MSFVKPMLATLVAEPFDKKVGSSKSNGMVTEPLRKISNQSIRLYSRNQKSFAEDYPQLVEALRSVKWPAVSRWRNGGSR